MSFLLPISIVPENDPGFVFKPSFIYMYIYIIVFMPILLYVTVSEAAFKWFLLKATWQNLNRQKQ